MQMCRLYLYYTNYYNITSSCNELRNNIIFEKIKKYYFVSKICPLGETWVGETLIITLSKQKILNKQP